MLFLTLTALKDEFFFSPLLSPRKPQEMKLEKCGSFIGMIIYQNLCAAITD